MTRSSSAITVPPWPWRRRPGWTATPSKTTFIRSRMADSVLASRSAVWAVRSSVTRGIVSGGPDAPRRRDGRRGHRADRSGAGYVDGDGDGVADDVPDGRE